MWGVSLDSKDTRRLIEADAAGVFVPPDHALFVRQETLFAQRRTSSGLKRSANLSRWQHRLLSLRSALERVPMCRRRQAGCSPIALLPLDRAF